jgi:tRNA(Ile)-lysidine synthase
LALRPDELFAGLAPKGIVVVAVSGGGDSMALLLLAEAWAGKHGHDLHAVTIDHGLRPEAAAEAAFVASVCVRHGIDHTTIAWHGRKPDAGLPQAARLARYELIESHAQAIGADLVLTAHTADDQAETVAMRLARGEAGSGLGRGLAGMARLTRLPGGTLLGRPLLAVDRAELRTYLREVGQAWIEDPTNQDESYERVRVRRALGAEPGRRQRLLALAGAMARCCGNRRRCGAARYGRSSLRRSRAVASP